MKIGFCMFLWTTNVTDKHRNLLRDIKATGYDGVEIPIFEGTPDESRQLDLVPDAVCVDLDAGGGVVLAGEAAAVSLALGQGSRGEGIAGSD